MTMEIDALHAGQPMRNGLAPCNTCADWLALKAERDGLMQTLRDEMDENLRLRELGGAGPDENITAMTERLIREREALREVAARMVAGIDHLDKLTREWEPDHSSGADRRGWLLAKGARDDAARLLGPNDRIQPRR